MRAWSKVVVALSMMLIGGCASAPSVPSPSAPPTVPTATPSAGPTATAAPTATPTSTLPTSPTAAATATPTPTATPEGIAVLMAGVAGRTGVELFYQPRLIDVPAGRVTFLLKNGTEAPHNLVIGPDAPVCSRSGCTYGPVVAASQAVLGGAPDELFTVDDLAAGTYSFWCSIDDHAQLGMVGTLNVGP